MVQSLRTVVSKKSSHLIKYNSPEESSLQPYYGMGEGLALQDGA